MLLYFIEILIFIEGEVMRIAIVDDDSFQLNFLYYLIKMELDSISAKEHFIDKYESGLHFLESWTPGSYDLIILDIMMEHLTGIEVAHKIREKDTHVRLAFCTASNEFASESYEVNAQHYLLKPITRDSISKLFQRLKLDDMEQERILHLPDGHPVILRNIIYTEYSNHVITFYIRNEAPYRIRITQAETEGLLFPHGFFISPYKGITVNLHAIDDITEDTLTMCDGTKLMITRRKLKEVRDAYKLFRLEQQVMTTG